VRDGWLHTGDLAEVDGEGYYRFVGRTDDLISSAGHRIGPGEIEECLVRPPVSHIGGSDRSPGRGPRRGNQGVRRRDVTVRGAGSGAEALVRERLAAYEVPREIEFVDELPLTTSGKIRRNELRQHERVRNN
jgi:acetyl-CoA synthetase